MLLGGFIPEQNIMARFEMISITAIMTVSTFEQALYWYQRIKNIPQTATFDHFMRVTGCQLSAKWDGKPITLAVDSFGQLFPNPMKKF